MSKWLGKRKVGRFIIVLLVGIFVSIVTTSRVEAKDLVGTKYTGSYSVDDPLSWNQCHHSYSNDVYPVWGESYCKSSCGAHSLTWVLLKSGVWDMSKSPKDAFTFFNKNGWASQGSGGYNSMGVGAPVTENGKTIEAVKYMSGNMDSFKTWARDMYDSGYYVIMNVPGHLIAMDYVDSDGDIVILDSADLCQYIECAVARWGNSITAWAYEVSGSKANDASSINFWDGDTVTGRAGGDDTNTSNGGMFPELNDEWKTPMVTYDDGIVQAQDKGLNTKEARGWMDWMFR